MNHKIHSFLFVLISSVIATAFTACGSDIFDHSDSMSMGKLTITLTDIGEQKEDFEVQLRNTATNSIFTQLTDNQGTAYFQVPPGLYEASVSARRSSEGYAWLYNGTSGQITVLKDQETQISIEMKQARISQLIVKELYCGGCMNDKGQPYQFDKCLIIYNNSALSASVSNLAIGMVAPANAQASNKNYGNDGKLTYEAEGFIPVWNGFWYFPSTLTIEPYSQVVVNISGAIDNTKEISQSVNYANSDYYCMYDPESGYINTSYYPTPSDVIPTSHHLKAIRFGQGNAWPLSNSSPALVLFHLKDITPLDFAAQTDNLWYNGNMVSQVNACLKVPNDWIVDAVEVYSSGYKNSCVKRLTADIDAGYVWMTNNQGHSVYRNVDRDATEALPENAGKLVYNYTLGADGSTDPSDIDAEASVSQGAHIVYLDTNNSSNDFHERQQCSLRK